MFNKFIFLTIFMKKINNVWIYELSQKYMNEYGLGKYTISSGVKIINAIILFYNTHSILYRLFRTNRHYLSYKHISSFK